MEGVSLVKSHHHYCSSQTASAHFIDKIRKRFQECRLDHVWYGIPVSQFQGIRILMSPVQGICIEYAFWLSEPDKVELPVKDIRLSSNKTEACIKFDLNPLPFPHNVRKHNYDCIYE